MDIAEIENIPFVFIVGRGRSGTTLLQNILDANENALLPRESKLIIHLKKKYFNVSVFSDSIIDALVLDLYKDRFFKNSWKVDRKLLVTKLKSYPKNKLNFSIVCKVIYLSYTSLYGTGKLKVMGDKNPVYSVFIPELLEVFPDAKFIHLIRDYRDNVVSNRKAFGEKSVEYLGYGWLFFNQEIEKEKRINQANFHTIKYEDLVANPQQNIIELCQFLSLEFNENMVHFNKKINTLFAKNSANKIVKNHKNLANPINSSQVEKYKTNLTQKEIEILDSICGSYAKSYGYHPDSETIKSVSALKRFYYSYKNNRVIWTIRAYYNSPFVFRDLIRYVSEKLFIWFNFSTKYNKIDFRLQNEREQTN